jgi:hypothetical protein
LETLSLLFVHELADSSLELSPVDPIHHAHQHS